MRYVGASLYLELCDLEQAGIKYNRVIVAKHRKSAGWNFLADPDDKRKVLVEYATLKADIKALVDATLGKAVTSTRVSSWSALIQVEATDLAAFRACVLPDGSQLSETVVGQYAIAAAWLRMLGGVTRVQITKWGYANTCEFHADVCSEITANGIQLPVTYTRLKAKLREFKTGGPLVLVSGRWGNNNSRKIEDAQSAWLIAAYAQPNKPDTAKVALKYLEVAATKQWPTLTEGAIYQHLHRSDVQPMWYIGRHGKDVWKSKYEHILKLRGPSFRDALWCSDGTKLNYFYQTDTGIMAKLQVYLVMDVYSEAVLGFSTDFSENFTTQFSAYKMALKASGHKPLQLLYDNQSGHKKKEQQEFLGRMNKVHFAAQPYNAKSKPIESLIGRMQKEVMRDRWFFTGQNITTKSLESRPNMEFILGHKAQLPSLEEARHYAAEDVAAWNARNHPKVDMARMDVYASSTNPQAQPIGFLDMVELFWHTASRPITYTNQGLQIEIGQHRLNYEVYANGLPSMEFLRQWTNAKFVVKYDPEDLSRVRLYRVDDSGELRFIASAESKRTYARAVVDLVPGERAEIDTLLDLRKAQAATIAKELDQARKASGIDPETLVEIGYRGTKAGMNNGESTFLGGQFGTDVIDIDPIDAL